MTELSTTALSLTTTAMYEAGTLLFMPEVYMVIVIWIIYVPIVAYFAREYYTYRNTMFMQKRKGAIMQMHFIITGIHLVLILPLVGMADAAWISTNPKAWEYWSYVGLFTYYMGSELFAYAIFYTMIWRTIMMWWEYNEHQALKNDEWMHYLVSGAREDSMTDKQGTFRMESVVSVSGQEVPDVNVITPEQSPRPEPVVRNTEYAWVFRYKKTLGNQWWVFRRLFCCYCAVAGTMYFFYVTAVDSYSAYWVGTWNIQVIFLIDLSIAVLHLLVTMSFWLATPSFHDPFKIRNEMRYMLLTYVAIPTISWIWFPMYGYFSVTVAESAIVAIQFTIIFALLMSSIGYSVMKGKTLGYLQIRTRQGSQTGESDPLSGESVPQANVNPSTPKTGIRKIRLQQVLAERKMLDLFAQHLVSEFSVECLLSVIEFCQFKVRLQADKDFMGLLQAEHERTKQKTEEMPMPKLPFKKLPRSHIVHGTIYVPKEWSTSDHQLLNEYKMRAFTLFERYVDPTTAELEINISYQERKRLMAIFDRERFWKKDGISCDQLMTVWDISMRSMIHLMGDSYGRFVRGSQFVHVTKHFANVKEAGRASLSMSIKNMKAAINELIPLETEPASVEKP